MWAPSVRPDSAFNCAKYPATGLMEARSRVACAVADWVRGAGRGRMWWRLDMCRDRRDSELPDVPGEWLAEFEAAARRPLALRMRYAFIRTYKPVLDDASFRAFDTMEEYRRWCEVSLPDWLGYGRV